MGLGVSPILWDNWIFVRTRGKHITYNFYPENQPTLSGGSLNESTVAGIAFLGCAAPTLDQRFAIHVVVAVRAQKCALQRLA